MSKLRLRCGSFRRLPAFAGVTYGGEAEEKTGVFAAAAMVFVIFSVAADAASAEAKKPPADFFVEATARPQDPYVQEQVLYTLKVFMGHKLRGQITPPQGDSRIIVKELGNPRNYRTGRGGRHYEVHERRYLMYPQKSDKIRIRPVVLSGVYASKGRRRSVKKQSRMLMLDVRPVPDSFPGKFWLPAAQLKITEKWPGGLPAWRAGEPIKRIIRLEATGLLARQLPEIELPDATGFRNYPESPSFNDKHTDRGIRGQRRQTMVLIPAQAGAYTLPGVRLPWWNTRTDRLEYAELPPRTVTIGEAAFSSLTVDEPSTFVAGEAAPTVVARVPGAGDANPWVWVSAALLIGWLTTALMTWRGVDWYRTFRRARRRRITMNRRIEAVRRACRSSDAEAARDALMTWARLQWSDDAPTSLGKIGARCGGLLQQQIEILEASLYRGDRWDGNTLWDSFSIRENGDDGNDDRAASDGLEPLHRL